VSMSMAWLAVYRNIDDDALAALASAGLVRRAAKDVDAGKVSWREPPGALGGVVDADGQRVVLDGAGPARAACDCPAPEMCKHVLAAAIWLRGAGAADAAVPPDAVSEILALDPAAVCKAAGAAATRRAHALFNEAPAAQLTVLPGALLIALPELDIACRFIGGAGYAGMVSEAPAASRAAVHLLVLASAWRAHGQAFGWPAALATAPAATASTLDNAERQFIARLSELLMEACRGGWSHVSEVMPAQLRALAMSARVEAFPRLAAMLRTLAGTSALLAARDVHADERQAIALAARIHALCHALAHATGEGLAELRGATRRTFEASAALALLPLGAHWWEQRGGARGLTLAFWDPAAARVMQATLARPGGSDPGFGRQQAWSTHALWPGAGTAAMLSLHTLALEQVRVSLDDNLSFSAATRARLLPPWQVDDARWRDAGVHDWHTLAGLIQASAGLRGAPLTAVLLQPASCDAPWLDEARQLFYWTLRDAHGAALTLQLPCGVAHHARIANLEAWSRSGTPIIGVLARIERGADGATLEPASILVAAGGTVRAVAPDYEGPAKTAPTLLERLARMLQQRPAQPATLAPAPAAPARFAWIEALQEMIEYKAMTGRLHLPGDDGPRLAQWQAWLRATGVDVVADAVQHYLAQPGADTALTLHYLCQACAELDTGTAPPPQAPQLSAP